jgi:hypothetical protein
MLPPSQRLFGFPGGNSATKPPPASLDFRPPGFDPAGRRVRGMGLTHLAFQSPLPRDKPGRKRVASAKLLQWMD